MAQPAVVFREIALDVRSLGGKTKERLLKIKKSSELMEEKKNTQTSLLNIRKLTVSRVFNNNNHINIYINKPKSKKNNYPTIFFF